jgi:uncharacterized protein (DUF1330 family)
LIVAAWGATRQGEKSRETRGISAALMPWFGLSAAVGVTITKHGGRFLVRGGAECEVIEGEFKPHRLAILEFPNRQSIYNLRDDAQYQHLVQVRRKTAKTITVSVASCRVECCK